MSEKTMGILRDCEYVKMKKNIELKQQEEEANNGDEIKKKKRSNNQT